MTLEMKQSVLERQSQTSDEKERFLTCSDELWHFAVAFGYHRQKAFANKQLLNVAQSVLVGI